MAGSGPPLVMVHALVGSAQNFLPNISALAQIRTVYALDLVNMGQSGRDPNADPRLEATADRIARWMQALELADAEVAGASHGGALCMMLAARHPALVRGLILFAPANPIDKLATWLLAFYSTRFGALFARTIPYMPDIVHEIAHRRVYGDQSKVNRAEIKGYTESLTPVSVQHVIGIVRAWWPDMAQLQRRLPALAAFPTLIFWGNHDRVVGLPSGMELARILGARLIIIPTAGHLVYTEDADQCNQAMLSWLSESDACPSGDSAAIPEPQVEKS